MEWVITGIHKDGSQNHKRTPDMFQPFPFVVKWQPKPSIRLWVQRTEFESQFTRKFSRRKFRSSAIYCGCKANHLEPTTNCLAFKQPNRITDRTVMYCVWHSNRQSRTSYHAWSIEHEKVHHPRNARLRAAYTPLLLWQ